MHTARIALLAVFFVALVSPARAEDAEVTNAREAFVSGAKLVKDARWAEALAAFERSAKLRPHPWTTYNVAACQRAMGMYTRARKTFRAALAENQASGGEALSESLVQDVTGYVAEIERVLAQVTVTLAPQSASVTVDGRPLEPVEGALVAGTLPVGPGEPPPAPTFRVVLDPGPHVFVMARKGFSDAVHRDTFVAGASTTVKLELDKLPGTLHVGSNQPQSVVTVNDLDVGIAPVILTRPAGRYHVTVRKKGYLPYDVETVLNAGEPVDLVAPMKEDRPSIVQRWWFWTAAGVVVAGAAVGTYFATRPSPERPGLSGGGLGWTVKTP